VTTAMFELPGVKKNDLKIELSRCQNGVKQVSITGESRQPLPDGLIALKERKYGKFRRVIPVRHDTKASRLNFPTTLLLKRAFSSEGRCLRHFRGRCSHSSHTPWAIARARARIRSDPYTMMSEPDFKFSSKSFIVRHLFRWEWCDV
jgi:hypothetical protein